MFNMSVILSCLYELGGSMVEMEVNPVYLLFPLPRTAIGGKGGHPRWNGQGTSTIVPDGTKSRDVRVRLIIPEMIMVTV